MKTYKKKKDVEKPIPTYETYAVMAQFLDVQTNKEYEDYQNALGFLICDNKNQAAKQQMRDSLNIRLKYWKTMKEELKLAFQLAHKDSTPALKKFWGIE